MDSQPDQQPDRKSVRLGSAVRQALVVIVCLAVGYFVKAVGDQIPDTQQDSQIIVEALPEAETLESDSDPVTTTVVEAPTVQSLPSAADTRTEVNSASATTTTSAIDAPPRESTASETSPAQVSTIVQRRRAGTEKPATAIPVSDDRPADAAQAEPPKLEYTSALTPGAAALPEGLDELEPGTLSRLTWHAGESLYGSSVPTPVLIASGQQDGPTLCLTAAVHGDEINGIETVRRVMYAIDPEKLKGRVIGVPIVNLQAFERHSRYLPDRRDLNRFFPGNTNGSSASRIARSFFEHVIAPCDALVDLHTGSFHRTNLPQLRANLDVPEVVALTEGFGSTVILHSEGGEGTLRAAATRAGIPAVTLEAGEPLRIDDKAVKHSTKALFTLMNTMGMYKRPNLWGNPEPTYYSSLWLRADKGGMLMGSTKLGKRVRKGDVLGTVVDPITNQQQDLLAPASGRVIGMALNQFVMPGYAAFHLGIEAPSLEELENMPEGSPAEFDHSVARTAEFENERDDS